MGRTIMPGPYGKCYWADTLTYLTLEEFRKYVYAGPL